MVVRGTDLAGNVGLDSSTNELTIEAPTGPKPVLVNDRLKISQGSMLFDRRTGLMSVEITITNISSTAITGPASLAVDRISDPGVTMANADELLVSILDPDTGDGLSSLFARKTS